MDQKLQIQKQQIQLLKYFYFIDHNLDQALCPKQMYCIIYDISNIRNYMNQAQRNSLQYEISLNSFKDEVANKQMILEKLNYEINLKMNSQGYKSKQSTCQVLRFCRRDIEEIQKIITDVRSYFVDLKLQFIYELMSELFKILISTFKILSQRFVYSLKQKKTTALREPEPNFIKSTQKLIEQFKGKNCGQMQYFDSLIKTIQMDQLRLAQKKREAEQKLCYQKSTIEMINASDAVNQLQSLKKHMDRVIMCSVKLGDEGNSYRSEYNNKQLRSLRRPEDIEQQYCHSIAESTKQKFIAKMHQISQKHYTHIRQNQKKTIIEQIKAEKPQHVEVHTQTCEDARTKGDYNKDKNVLIGENQQLRKANSTLKKQMSDLNSELKDLTQEHSQLQRKIQYSTELLTKKMMELQKSKIDFQHSLNKKNLTIQALNKKIVQIRSERNAEERMAFETPPNEGSQRQGDDTNSILSDQNNNEQSLSLKHKGSATNRTSFFYEKQFRATKQQNCHLRRSLTIMLDALKQQKLILEYPISDLNNDLKLGKLIDKIEAISIELLNKVKQIKLRDPHKDEQKLKRYTKKVINVDSFESRPNIKTFTQVQTQTIAINYEFGKDDVLTNAETDKKSLNNFNVNSANAVDEKGSENLKQSDDKLEMLKKQLINRVNAGKRKHGSIKRSRMFLHEIDNLKNHSNTSVQNLKSFDQQKSMRRNSKTRPAFNRKDISFQQFKFELFQNKSEEVQKKLFHQSKKSHNNLKMTQNKDKRRFNNRSYEINPISQFQQQTLGINGYQCITQVKKILQLIEVKSEQKQSYYKQFVKLFVQELKRLKGVNFVEDAFSNKSSRFHIDRQNQMTSLLSAH